MAVWKNTTKTLKGLALDQKLLATSSPLKLKSAKSGASSINPTQLALQTSVSSPKQFLELKGAILLDDNTVTIPVALSNANLAVSYSLFQVGIFAEDPDEGDILYIIAQTEITGGETVPSANDSPGYSIDWNFAVNVGNASTVEVTLNEAGKLTLEQADARYAKIQSPVLSGVPEAPTAEKGTATNQIATTLFVNNAVSDFSGGGVVVSATAPEKTNVLWIDTANGGVAKYYGGTSWLLVASTWG